jgi:hypothetical protein
VVKRSVRGVRSAGVLAGLVSVGLLAGVAPVAPAVASPTGVRVDPVQAPARAASGAAKVVALGAATGAAADGVNARGTVQVRTYKMEAGGRYRLRGRVVPKGKRPVILAEKKGRKWKKRAKTTSAKNGKYAFIIAAGSKVGKRQFLLTVPRHKGRKGYSARFNVKVVAAATPTPTPTPVDITIAFNTTTAVSRSGQAFTVTGALTGTAAAGRAVVLQQAWADGWHNTAATATTGADGSFVLTLPASWLYTSQMRVYTAPVPGATEGASAPVTVTSTPGWTPQGTNPAAWSLLVPGQRTRWNPCQVITVQGNFAQAPAQAREAFMAALADVSEASGLQFSYVRDTNGVPVPEPGQPAFGADVALGMAWVNDAQTKWDMSTVLGMAGPRAGVWGKDAAGRVAWTTSGDVAMNAAHRWDYSRMVATYRHELGHVLGLGHTDVDSSQLMWWQENGFQTFGTGDLAGMAAVGAQQGCISAWTGRTAAGEGPEFPTIAD